MYWHLLCGDDERSVRISPGLFLCNCLTQPRKKIIRTCPTAPIFIAELIKAANELDRLATFEVSCLLDRSVDTIRDMREQTGVEQSALGRDVVIYLQTSSARAKGLPEDQARDALLDAAETIQTLKMMLDAKDEVLRGE